MYVTGRTIRARTLAERRLLLSKFGQPTLRVPRGTNPFLVARKLSRVANGESAELLFVREALTRRRPRPSPPTPSPEVDRPEPGPLETADGTPPVAAE